MAGFVVNLIVIKSVIWYKYSSYNLWKIHLDFMVSFLNLLWMYSIPHL